MLSSPANNARENGAHTAQSCQLIESGGLEVGRYQNRQSSQGCWIHQSRLRFEDGKMYLLRVVVDEDDLPPVIITAYRTSKIEKYWSTE